MPCNCGCPDNTQQNPNLTAAVQTMQQQQIGVPSLMVSPEQNQFSARGYSLCYEDVFHVIAEARRNGFPVVRR